jgi:drug/metabolite transporter (DMT)-like permease
VYGVALALLSALLFGASTPASKLLLGSFEPFQLAGLLYLGAALGMAPVVGVQRRRGAPMAFDRGSARRLAGAVFFGGLLGPVLLLFGLRLAGAGSVSLLLNLDPATRHSHAHVHERLVHGHPHWPDIHHRHDHGRAPGDRAQDDATR